MVYIRPKNLRKFDKAEKVSLCKDYVNHYRKSVQEQGTESINVKIPREVFAPVLDMIGKFLLDQSDQLLENNEDIQNFLQANPLPPRMMELLPDKFRVFSLLLNALKQWVTAESLATDRFLLGGIARQICRMAVSHCLITGEALDEEAELHHPVRDGRPPILLSTKGHEIVERILSDSGTTRLATPDETLTKKQNELWQRLQLIRSKRNQSWKQLREGCATLLRPGTPCRPNAKSFANVVIQTTDSTPEEIMQLLDAVGK